MAFHPLDAPQKYCRAHADTRYLHWWRETWGSYTLRSRHGLLFVESVRPVMLTPLPGQSFDRALRDRLPDPRVHRGPAAQIQPGQFGVAGVRGDRFALFDGPSGMIQRGEPAVWQVVPILEAVERLVEIPHTLPPLAMLSVLWSAQQAEPDAADVAFDLLERDDSPHLPPIIAERRRETWSQLEQLAGGQLELRPATLPRVPRPRTLGFHTSWRIRWAA